MVRAIPHLANKSYPIQNDRVHATHPVPIKNAEAEAEADISATSTATK